MGEKSKDIEDLEVLYIDYHSKPRNDQAREEIRQYLRHRFEGKLPEAVERIWDLPKLVLKNPSEIYTELLIEAFDLYLDGYFYSCVAMCGIVGERIIKDELRAAVLIKKGNQVGSPDSTAFDQFERLDVSSIARFLNKAELLSDKAFKAADSLGQLRNSYVHARGKDPKADAISAIKMLHTLIEDTVSIFKDFVELKGGTLVKKPYALSK